MQGNRGKGKFVLVDDEDYPYLSQFNWNLNNNGYPRMTKKHNRKYMHQLILKDSKRIDHIDGNPLNNTRKNLRSCTQSENTKNHSLNKNNTSGYKGVGWHKQMKKWRAYIEVNWEHKSLGLYNTKEQAAIAYNMAAKKYFGEFAKLNPL